MNDQDKLFLLTALAMHAVLNSDHDLTAQELAEHASDAAKATLNQHQRDLAAPRTFMEKGQ